MFLEIPNLKSLEDMMNHLHKDKFGITKHQICKQILQNCGYKVSIGYNYCEIYKELASIIYENTSGRGNNYLQNDYKLIEYCTNNKCSPQLYKFLRHNNIDVKFLPSPTIVAPASSPVRQSSISVKDFSLQNKSTQLS